MSYARRCNRCGQRDSDLQSLKKFLALFPIILLIAVGMSSFGLHGFAGAALAQDSNFADDDPVAKAPATLDQLQKKIDSLASIPQKAGNNDRELMEAKSSLDDIVGQLQGMKLLISPRQDDIAARLKELGDPPKDGQPAEAADVTQQRNKLNAQKAQIASVLNRIDEVSKSASDMSIKVTAVRRELFTRQLLAHTDISVDSMTDAALSYGTEASRFTDMLEGWGGFAWRFKKISLVSAMVLSLAMALGLRLVLQRILGPIIERGKLEENPSYMSRFSVAFWATIMPSFAFSFFLISSYFFLDTFSVMRPDIEPIIASFFGVFWLVFFSSRLAIAVFNPWAPKWRLVHVSDRGSRQLVAAFVAMTVINGLDYGLSSIAQTLGSPVELSVLKGLVSSSLVGLILLWVSFIRPLLPKSEDEAATGGRPWSKRTAIALRVCGVWLIFTSLIGYIGLARFVASQLILTGGVAATMYIGIRSGRAVSERDRFAETIVGRFLQRRFNFGPVALDQFGIAAGLLIYGFVFVIGVPLIMMSWGFQPPDIQTWFYNLFIQIDVGGISISIVGIFSGIAIFLIGVVLTRWFEKWLDGNVMARSQVDPGVRNSVKTSVGYFGAIVAGFMGLSAAGINLSSLALVAGALSVGIGFGLQNIISNFVSGLILLFERPFKVGDWVATGTSEGFVRRISVRATEIETFQRQSIIVPNSQLINASVGNWTHRNKLGRIDMEISAKAVNDPRHVMGMLREVASDVPGVLRTPEPVVVFKKFDGADLEFEVRVFVGDVLNGLVVRNELRLGIFERFKAEGVVMKEEPAEAEDVVAAAAPLPPSPAS
ncbi:mechanosensitive ion channel family protein [Agrobacterium vitis]|uniref:Mechanosensitive ion channel n=1 Tax=Agrobacterium vitis TaxID=373 RepID=A0AAE5AUP4_AGRVI|nr:mechanosensitive ion channel family protein [Allorhizobium sp. Av2]MCM2438108.1 mechanosensitive ion channel family protein [Agrobacterium vitis]MUZ56511.1 mechanosensitive ion channel [Agrobacterium vitis]MVA64352.1 mechanosensitive ion channel [Agrobacterium vitis]MVA85324.1 mechanosensitive ion channel [Agrobacterium vitis]